MAKIWLLEKDAFKEGSIASRIAGSCFLRLVASTKALKNLVSIEKDSFPDILLVKFPLNLNGLHDLVDLKSKIPMVVYLKSELYEIAMKKFMHHQNLYFLNEDQSSHFDVFEIFGLIKKFQKDSTKIKFKDVTLQPRQLQLLIEAQSDPIELPLKEMQLLRAFMEKPGVIMSRQQLVEEVWGNSNVGNRTVDAHVSRLRSRLDGAEIEIESIYRKGYQLI